MDHKPLVPLVTGASSTAPPRIERWAVQLQPYSFEVVYRPGVNNQADYLSRRSRPTEADKYDIDKMYMEKFVSMVVQDLCPVAMTTAKHVRETDGDATLQRVKEAMANKLWKRFLHDVTTLNPRRQNSNDSVVESL